MTTATAHLSLVPNTPASADLPSRAAAARSLRAAVSRLARARETLMMLDYPLHGDDLTLAASARDMIIRVLSATMRPACRYFGGEVHSLAAIRIIEPTEASQRWLRGAHWVSAAQFDLAELIAMLATPRAVDAALALALIRRLLKREWALAEVADTLQEDVVLPPARSAAHR